MAMRAVLSGHRAACSQSQQVLQGQPCVASRGLQRALCHAPAAGLTTAVRTHARARAATATATATAERLTEAVLASRRPVVALCARRQQFEFHTGGCSLDAERPDQATPPRQPQPPRRNFFSAVLKGRGALNKLFERTGLIKDPAIRSIVSATTVIGAWGGAGIMLLGTLGVDTSPLVALGSVAGIATGFAIRDIGSNYAAGVLVAVTQPFVVGDWIRLGKASDGVEGQVVEMDLRHVHLLKEGEPDPLLVPNSAVNSSVLMVTRATPEVTPPVTQATLLSQAATPSHPPNHPLPPLPAEVITAAGSVTALNIRQATQRYPGHLHAGIGPDHAKVLTWLAADPARASQEPWASFSRRCTPEQLEWLPATLRSQSQH